MGDVDRQTLTCVLFDLYGTLLDLRLNEDSPTLWQGLTEALRRCGGAVDEPAALRGRFRQILKEQGERDEEGFLMEPTFHRLLASVGARDELDFIGRRFRQLSIEEISIRPYVEPLFQALRQTSCAVAIVSNTEAVLTRSDLGRFPLLLSVDAIVLSSEVGIRKPDPRIFQIALSRVGASAASAVFVGNSIADDIEGARSVGLPALYLDEGAPGVERLRGPGTVLRVQPALEPISRALGMAGWRPSSPS